MKGIIALVSVMIAIVLVPSVHAQQIYENSAFGVFLEYPEDWHYMDVPPPPQFSKFRSYIYDYEVVFAPIDSGVQIGSTKYSSLREPVEVMKYPESASYVLIQSYHLRDSPEYFKSLTPTGVKDYISDWVIQPGYYSHTFVEEPWGWSVVGYESLIKNRYSRSGYVVYDSNETATWYTVSVYHPTNYKYDTVDTDSIINSLVLNGHIVPEFHEVILIMSILIISTIIITRLPRNSNLLHYNS